MPHEPRRPDPRPVQVNETRIVAVGLALWVLALVVLAVFFRDDLRRHHAMWWLWACVVGIALGLYGLRFVSRRDRSRG
jgi:membrane protein DedA with SNARE-associated domain